MIRLFDILFSLLVLLIFMPLLLLIALLVLITSPGGIIYKQVRVGKNGKEFKLLKFRTMYKNADRQGLLTVGKDNRITSVGRMLRKYKLDELPQFINVLIGDMSIVGPRPEVPKYVQFYNDQQKQVLSVKPGITDYASLVYFDENRQLAQSTNPEEYYIKHIMPHKLSLSLQYIQKKSFVFDMKIIALTFLRILGIQKKI